MNNNNLTFNQVYCNYLNYISTRLKPTTILGIKRKFKNHILPIFENKNIYLINDNDFLKWENYVKNLGYSDSFNNQVFSIIKLFFDYLKRFYNIENFPLKFGKFKCYNTSQNKQDIDVWSIKDYKKFIKCVDDKIYHALFNLLFFTGVRKGEALALKFKDLNKNYISINHNITKEFFNGKRLEFDPKTKKSIRKIRIDYKLRHELNKLRKYYITHYNNFNENFYIFGGTKPLATTTLERKKNYYCKTANVKQIRIHDFRHSHATILYNNGIKIKYIQQRLGHADISTTLNTYVHDNSKYEKRVTLLLNFLRFRF